MATAQTPATAESPANTPARHPRLLALAHQSRAVGYGSLLLIALLLPFDLDRQPLLWTGYLTITNLTVLLFLVALLAGLTLTLPFGTREGSHAVGYVSRRLPHLGLFAALLLTSALSTLLAHRSAQGLTWWLDIAIGALLWLAIPLWLGPDPDARIRRLVAALVAGAVVAALIGFVEVIIGSSFDRHLTAFKTEATTLGPFVRLSGTFSHANVAAMYFALVLPFALIALLQTLAEHGKRDGKAAGRPAIEGENGTRSAVLLKLTGYWHWLRFATWLAIVDVLLAALFLTYTRGAWLGLAVGIVVMAIGGRHRLRWRLFAGTRGRGIVAIANLAVIAGALVLSTSSIDRLRLSTQNDSAWYQAGYSSNPPRSMLAGRLQIVPVTVTNESPLTWNAADPHTYGLSYHWLRESGSVYTFANRITWLTANLPPGGRETVPAGVRAPALPGSYRLVWDMIWEGTTWFGPKTGEYHAVPIQSVGSSGSIAGQSASRRATVPAAIDLPDDRPLDRGTIWSIAWRMFEARPILGEGPEGVRMNYAAFAAPAATQATAPAPAHAHNLVLEIAADWGIVGLLLWAVLLLLLWRPLIASLWRGSVESLWQLAVIGAAAAFLTHGLVDYFLQTQAIVILFWVLCGLASVRPKENPERAPRFR